jgi:hypothetical protein
MTAPGLSAEEGRSGPAAPLRDRFALLLDRRHPGVRIDVCPAQPGPFAAG